MLVLFEFCLFYSPHVKVTQTGHDYYYSNLGKGTQCQLLSERLPHQRKQELWVHLSAGDLLRAERAKGSTLAKEINQYIDAGRLVPSHITCQLLLNAMIDAYHNSSQRAQGSPVTHFLIDGFPRSQSNLDAWNAMTKTNDSTDATTTASTVTALTISPPHNTFSYHVQFVLNYSCPEETLVGRILERAKTQSRTDDNITTIQARFRTFEQETKPILEYYQSRYNDAAATGDDGATQVPVYTIATDQPVEAVYQQTIQYFQ